MCFFNSNNEVSADARKTSVRRRRWPPGALNSPRCLPVVGVNLKDEGLDLEAGGDNPFVGTSSTKIRLLCLKQNPWNLLWEE